MNDLSITIVAYRDYEDIKNAVSSIERHTDSRIKKKIYVVDNGKKEVTETEHKSFIQFMSQYSDTEYLDAGQNLGFGKAHNFVLSSLDSKYHAIVNPDIVLVEDSFSKIISYLNTNIDVGMCIPKIMDEHGDLSLVYRQELTVFDMFIRMFCKGLFPKRVAKHTMQYCDYSRPFQVPFGQGSFLVINTDLFRKLEGFDERYFMYIEDADLCKRVNEISKLMYFPYTQVIHKWKQGSHKNMLLFKCHLKSMYVYFRKWGFKLV